MGTTYIVDVTNVDSFQHLPENSSDSVFVKTCWRLIKVIKYSMVDELKHEVQMFLAAEHFDQIH